MSKCTRMGVLWLICGLGLMSATRVSAVDFQYSPRHYSFAARGGFIYASVLRVDGKQRFDTEMGLSGGILFDLPISRKLVAGLAFDLHDIKIEEARKKLFDVSLGLKRTFFLPEPNFTLRIGGAAGFGYMGPTLGYDRTTFLTLKATVEGVFPISMRYAWIVDVSVIRLPTGGNREVRANFGPTVIGRVGILM